MVPKGGTLDILLDSDTLTGVSFNLVELALNDIKYT